MNDRCLRATIDVRFSYGAPLLTSLLRLRELTAAARLHTNAGGLLVLEEPALTSRALVPLALATVRYVFSQGVSAASSGGAQTSVYASGAHAWPCPSPLIVNTDSRSRLLRFPP